MLIRRVVTVNGVRIVPVYAADLNFLPVKKHAGRTDFNFTKSDSQQNNLVLTIKIKVVKVPLNIITIQ